MRPGYIRLPAQEHRGKINFFIVLPLSFIYDWFWGWRNWYYVTFCTTPHLHDERVAEVQRQVRLSPASPPPPPHPPLQRAETAQRHDECSDRLRRAGGVPAR